MEMNLPSCGCIRNKDHFIAIRKCKRMTRSILQRIKNQTPTRGSLSCSTSRARMADWRLLVSAAGRCVGARGADGGGGQAKKDGDRMGQQRIGGGFRWVCCAREQQQLVTRVLVSWSRCIAGRRRPIGP
jgi:hypothetical protein